MSLLCPSRNCPQPNFDFNALKKALQKSRHKFAEVVVFVGPPCSDWCRDLAVHKDAVAQITAETHAWPEREVNELFHEVPADFADGWYSWQILLQAYEDIFKQQGLRMPRKFYMNTYAVLVHTLLSGEGLTDRQLCKVVVFPRLSIVEGGE